MSQVFPQSSSLPVMPSHLPQAQNHVYVRIQEQPTNKIIRFRYKCEGRTASPIPGINSTDKNKTYPTIEIVGYDGEWTLVVSCVTKDKPYRQHPHCLIIKENTPTEYCKSGVYNVRVPAKQSRFELQKIGIQCVKKIEARESLEEREKRNIDPFLAKFDHKDHLGSINFHELLLCYQVFINDPITNKMTVGLEPIVSTPIIGKSNELTICQLCSCSAKVSGGDQIILLCEKVNKDDIRVRFFETDQYDKVVWQDLAEFNATDVHKQTAIVFRTPRYHNLHVTESVQVKVELFRPSDGATSAALPFEFYPSPGMLTFAHLQRKLKRKQDLDIFQQILSLDSETTATKYSCPPIEIDENTVSSSSSDDQHSSGTLNEFEIAVKNLRMRRDDTETAGTGTQDGDDDGDYGMEIELEVPQLLPQLADDCTQTSTPMEEILQQPQLQSRALTTVDKINEWMRSSEFERTDSMTVENGDSQSLSSRTAQTAFTNVSSLTANTTITNNLDEDRDHVESRRDTLDNGAVKELPGELDIGPSASAQASVDIDEQFDETATYTSLQIAYNNPISMPNNSNNNKSINGTTNPFNQMDDDELVVLTNPPAPMIQVNKAQTPATPNSPPLPLLPPRTPSPVVGGGGGEQKLPPLPPKPRHSQDLSVSVSDHSPSVRSSRNGSVSSARTTTPSPSPIVIMRTPDQSPTKRQPAVSPTPSSTASPKKRQGFFSRLFSRRRSSKGGAGGGGGDDQSQSSATHNGSNEPSLSNFILGEPQHRASTRSARSTLDTSMAERNGGRPVGRSSSSVSGKRPAHLNADVIHIPLKGGDSENSLLLPDTLSFGRPLDRKTLSTLQLADIPISDGNMELIAIADRQSIRNLCDGAYGVVLDPSVDLSEAEHFALYTSKSPEPSNGGGGADGGGAYDDDANSAAAADFLSADEIARRLAEANEFMMEQRRNRGRETIESVKRKLDLSIDFPSSTLSPSPKQPKTISIPAIITQHPLKQQKFEPHYQQQQLQTDQEPTFIFNLAQLDDTQMPNDLFNIKAETFKYETDSSRPTTASPHFPASPNYPASPSSCNTMDSCYAQQQQQTTQWNGGGYTTYATNTSTTTNTASNGNSPTAFNGGSITYAIANNNNNNNNNNNSQLPDFLDVPHNHQIIPINNQQLDLISQQQWPLHQQQQQQQQQQIIQQQQPQQPMQIQPQDPNLQGLTLSDILETCLSLQNVDNSLP